MMLFMDHSCTSAAGQDGRTCDVNRRNFANVPESVGNPAGTNCASGVWDGLTRREMPHAQLSEARCPQADATR
jgi:hypothetical protein